MHEFICEYCGKTVVTEHMWYGRKFCSRACGAKGRYKHNYSTMGEMLPRNPTGECIFQPESIECSRLNCDNCGWNPEVAKARLDKIMGGMSNAN